MSDVRVERLAMTQDGLVTWRGLIAAGMNPDAVDRAVAGLRRLHVGVFVTGHGRITTHQRHLAATLSADGSVLSHASATALWNLRPSPASFEVVTRPGSGGPRRMDGLLVCRSNTVDGGVTTEDGVAVTTPARTVVDLAAHVDARLRDRLATEALRLGLVSPVALRNTVLAHRGRRGVAGLAAHVERLAGLPIERTKSHAETRALELVAATGIASPSVNVRRAGEEADLSWIGTRRIVEVDGPQFHRDSREDDRKTAAWIRGGWSVARIPSDVVFLDPERLVSLVRWASGADTSPAATERPRHRG